MYPWTPYSYNYIKMHGHLIWTKDKSCSYIIIIREEADPYAVASRQYPRHYQTSGNIIGHMPCRISATCNLFIQKGVLLYAKLLAHDVNDYSSDMPTGE